MCVLRTCLLLTPFVALQKGALEEPEGSVYHSLRALCDMAKLPVDVSLFVEDARVVLRSQNGSTAISAYPADIHTKDWCAKRQKDTNRTNIIAPFELQWCSLGILEFMEVDGEIWNASVRKKQITFFLSMLTPDHVEALKTQIERKHGVHISREQIQPIVMTGFQATIEVDMHDVRRVFQGSVKNLDALRPLSCVFSFDSQSDMELVMNEINSEEGVTLTCQVAVGGVRYEPAALTIPNKKLTDANIAALAFGANTDSALFTPSQLDALAQMIVNVVTIPEAGAVGAIVADLKPLVVTALHAVPVEVQLSPEMLPTLSPLNGEDGLLADQMSRLAGSMEEFIRGGEVDMSPHRPPQSPPAGSKSKKPLSAPPGGSAKKTHKESADFEEKSSHNRQSKEVHSGTAAQRYQMGIAEARRAVGGGGGRKKLYRVLRSKLSENIALQWYKMNGTAQSCVYAPMSIESKTHVCQYTERSYRDEPRKATNVSVLRLPQSAWVHFRGPSDSGGSPIVAYTVHAQPLTADPVDPTGAMPSPRTLEAKETREGKKKKHKVSCMGTMSPINVGPLRENMDYRYVIECTNAAGTSSMTDPVLHTIQENEMFAVVPLYGVILYAGPLENIPANFRRLDGSEGPGVPNLHAAFKITPQMKDQALAPAAGAAAAPAAAAGAVATADPKWASLCYIQRIA